MSNYFQNFPVVKYKFGDETTSSLFQNISAYVDVLDIMIDPILCRIDYMALQITIGHSIT